MHFSYKNPYKYTNATGGFDPFLFVTNFNIFLERDMKYSMQFIFSQLLLFEFSNFNSAGGPDLASRPKVVHPCLTLKLLKNRESQNFDKQNFDSLTTQI